MKSFNGLLYTIPVRDSHWNTIGWAPVYTNIANLSAQRIVESFPNALEEKTTWTCVTVTANSHGKFSHDLSGPVWTSYIFYILHAK